MVKKKYLKAPIVEAVIEMRWQDDVPTAELEKIQKKLFSDYPIVENEVTFAVNVVGESASVSHKPTGRKLKSLDGLNIVLLRPNATGFVRLAPYEGWEEFSKTVKVAWKIVKKIIGHQKLTRIATRYVNRLDIPFPDQKTIVNFDEYLTVGVDCPKESFPSLENYQVQLNAKFGEGFVGTIRTGTGEPMLIGHTAIILDVDMSIETSVPQNEKALWLGLERLREMKNKTFEASITDKSRALFKGEQK